MAEILTPSARSFSISSRLFIINFFLTELPFGRPRTPAALRSASASRVRCDIRLRSISAASANAKAIILELILLLRSKLSLIVWIRMLFCAHEFSTAMIISMFLPRREISVLTLTYANVLMFQGSVPSHKNTLVLEADYLFNGGMMAGLGAEYCIADIAFLRAGYHYGDPANALASYASLGLGEVFSGFSIDLAFLTASETLGNTFMMGLGYSF